MRAALRVVVVFDHQGEGLDIVLGEEGMECGVDDLRVVADQGRLNG